MWARRPGERTMTIGKKITWGFALPLAILAVVGAVAYWSTARIIDTSQAVTHHHEILERIEKVLSVMKDAETAQRGYIITGKDSYLGTVSRRPFRASPGVDKRRGSETTAA